MTQPLMARLRTFLRRKAREEDGTATVPFVILFPAFMVIVLSSIGLTVSIEPPP